MQGLVLVVGFLSLLGWGEGTEEDAESSSSYPSVLVCVLARNKAHTLPYFLGLLEDLDYPKDRIHLFLRTDHNEDNTSARLREWVDGVRSLYGSIDIEIPTEGAGGFPDETGPFHWTTSRFLHLIALKEEALYKARKIQMDYILFVDCDQFILNHRTLQHLMWADKAIVAPVMRALESNYSNFWAGITPEGYYQRHPDYIPILRGEKRGAFPVPVVHSFVLVDLRLKASKLLTFSAENLEDYAGPVDDVLVFAESARVAGMEMHVLNTRDFGLLLEPAGEEGSVKLDVEAMRYLLLESEVEGPPGLLHSPHCPPEFPEPSKMGYDEVYLINLERREERRRRMERAFRLLGLRPLHWPATDGQALTEEWMAGMGIKMLPEYADPYHKRPLTMGEIGCFMSHYRIWEDMVQKGFNKVLVFEDDLRFIKFFIPLLRAIVEDVEETSVDWDLIYLGRKRLDPSKDGASPVPGTRYLTHVSYSYWTLAYALSLRGAKKLLGGEPLVKMVPVDEYLPIMFNEHPETGWMTHFPKRDLKAFTSEPLLVYPTHYTGDRGYISDTENATVIDEKDADILDPRVIEEDGGRGAAGEFHTAKDEL